MKREDSFKLAPRPKAQSLFRKLGCIGGFCGLLFSSLLIFALIIWFEFKNEFKNGLKTIPSQNLTSYNQSQIVQPFFINNTRFDVLASIWTPGLKGNESELSNKNQTASEVRDHVFWTGVLQKNISFFDGNVKNLTVPVDLDLSYLWSLPKLQRHSVVATISLYPRMNSTALSLPQHENLAIGNTSLVFTQDFPLNHDFLNSKEFTPDTSDELRNHFRKTGAMPVHTVPLLYVRPEIKGKEKESPEVYLNTRVKVEVEHQIASYHRKAFEKGFNNVRGIMGRCLHSIRNSSSDVEKDWCLNTDLGSPIQSLIEFKPKVEGDDVGWDQNRNPQHSESPKDSSRFFYVPYLILKTSASQTDFISLSPNETFFKFNWKSESNVTSLSSYRGIFDGRASQTFDQLSLDGKMLANSTSVDDFDYATPEELEYMFSTMFWVEGAIGLFKGLSEYVIVFFCVLYFHTRATTLGISLPAVLFSSFFYLLEIIFSKFVVHSKYRAHCDAAIYWARLSYWLLPWIYLSLLQLWFVSRLKIERQKGRWIFLTLRQLPADHSERQSAREDDELSMVSRIGLLMGLTVVLSILKPQCFYLQIGAIGNLFLPTSNLQLVLYALPQAGRVLGEVMQLRLNRQQRTFAGAFKITIIIRVIRNLLDTAHNVLGESRQPQLSKLDFITNGSALLLTFAWLFQALHYRSVPQLRDEDQDD